MSFNFVHTETCFLVLKCSLCICALCTMPEHLHFEACCSGHVSVSSEAVVHPSSLSRSGVWTRNNIPACFAEWWDGLSISIKISWREKQDQEKVWSVEVTTREQHFQFLKLRWDDLYILICIFLKWPEWVSTVPLEVVEIMRLQRGNTGLVFFCGATQPQKRALVLWRRSQKY